MWYYIVHCEICATWWYEFIQWYCNCYHLLTGSFRFPSNNMVSRRMYGKPALSSAARVKISISTTLTTTLSFQKHVSLSTVWVAFLCYHCYWSYHFGVILLMELSFHSSTTRVISPNLPLQQCIIILCVLLYRITSWAIFSRNYYFPCSDLIPHLYIAIIDRQSQWHSDTLGMNSLIIFVHHFDSTLSYIIKPFSHV